jgi:hypothetical protein
VVGGSATTDALGIAKPTSWTLGTTAGANTLTATAAGLSGSPLTFSATGTAAVATSIAKNAGDNQTGVAGQALATTPSVKVTDASGNPAAGVSVTFAVATGAGSVAGASVATNANGIAAPTSWTLGTTAGGNSLTATSAGLSGSPVTFTATGTAGTASALQKFAGDAQTAQVSTAVATKPSVKLVDAHGNAVSGVTVTFAVASGGGSVSGATQVTSASGLATVGSWTLGASAGANTLSASATGVTTVTFSATGTTSQAPLGICAPTTGFPVLWAAYQDGNGPWTAASVTNGVYSIPITASGGISFVYDASDIGFASYYQETMFATRSELSGLASSGGCTTTTTSPGTNPKTLTGTVSGLATNASQQGIVIMGASEADLSLNGGFVLTDVMDGNLDLFAMRAPVPANGVDFDPDRIIVRRNQNPANNAALPLLDFGSSEALAPTGTLTLSGVAAGDFFIGFSLLATANVSFPTMKATGSASAATATDIVLSNAFLNPAQQLGTDFYLAELASTTGTADTRVAVKQMTAGASRSIALGPYLATPTVISLTSTAPVRRRIQLASQSAYPSSVSYVGVQTYAGNERYHSISVSQAYAGGTPATWDFSSPDVTGTGFQAVWGMQPGVSISEEVSASSSSFDLDGPALVAAMKDLSPTSLLMSNLSLATTLRAPAMARRVSPAVLHHLGSMACTNQLIPRLGQSRQSAVLPPFCGRAASVRKKR